MPRGIRNWTYRDVASFLAGHGFMLHHTRGSHHYFLGKVAGNMRQVSVQYHASKSIPLGTMKAIMRQSGIPENVWRS